MIKKYTVFMLSTHYSCQIFMKLECSRQVFEKYSNIKFHENPFSGSRVVSCGRTVRQDEVNSPFPFHLRYRSPCWALAALRRRLYSSLSSAHLLHPRIPSTCDVSLRTTSSHLVLGFHTGRVL